MLVRFGSAAREKKRERERGRGVECYLCGVFEEKLLLLRRASWGCVILFWR